MVRILANFKIQSISINFLENFIMTTSIRSRFKFLSKLNKTFQTPHSITKFLAVNWILSHFRWKNQQIKNRFCTTLRKANEIEIVYRVFVTGTIYGINLRFSFVWFLLFFFFFFWVSVSFSRFICIFMAWAWIWCSLTSLHFQCLHICIISHMCCLAIPGNTEMIALRLLRQCCICDLYVYFFFIE